MHRETKLLLIEDDPQQRQNIAYIFNFMDEEFIAADSSKWRDAVKELSNPREILCAFVSMQDSAQALTLVKEICR